MSSSRAPFVVTSSVINSFLSPSTHKRNVQIQGSKHFKKMKFPDFRLMNFQNSRIIYFQFEAIFDGIAENSSGSEQGETKDTGMYCMYTSMYYYNTGT